MLRTLLKVPKESRVMVVVSLTVLLQVLVLSGFGLAGLRGIVAEREKDTVELCRRVLDGNLVDEVDRRIREEEAAARATIAGRAADDPGLAWALESRVGGIYGSAFVIDAAGAWRDRSGRLLWPAAGQASADLGGDAVLPFDLIEDAVHAGGDLAAAIAETRALLAKSGEGRPIGLRLLARLELEAGHWRSAIRVHDEIVEEFPTAVDRAAMRLPLGPAAAARRAEIRLERFRRGEAGADEVVSDVLDLRRLLLLNRHQLEVGWSDHFHGVLGALAAAAAAELPLGDRTTLADGIARIAEQERSLLVFRRVFGEELEAAARGETPGGLLWEVLPDGPRVVFTVPLRGGLAVLELDLLRLRTLVLPELLASLPLPDGVAATVVDAEGNSVVAGPGDPDRRILAKGRFEGALPFWTPIVTVLDPGFAERRTAASRRLHYWIMGVSIAGILAAAWFVLRTVKHELHDAKMKSDFLSTVTHELKTPLTSIRMFIETLMEGRVKDEGERREYLGVISREADRLTGLIQRVLDLARLEGRTAALNRKSADLGAILAESADIFRRRMAGGDAELEVAVPDDLPKAKVDPGAVQELLLNLLSNALKYGGKRIRLGASVRDGNAVLEVEDDGIGIAEEEQGRIFEKFYRADDSLARSVEGSGLGLALVGEIARAHGGSVGLFSKKGEGSRFTVTLPLRG
ncbi:MAG: sensor histidine kinase [Planctomycetota bacterium]|jgi:signal transduction histidine kinase